MRKTFVGLTLGLAGLLFTTPAYAVGVLTPSITGAGKIQVASPATNYSCVNSQLGQATPCATLNFGVAMTLTATPQDAEWQLDRWTGCDLVRGADCVVTAPTLSRVDKQPVAHFKDVTKPQLTLQALPANIATGYINPVFSSSEPSRFACRLDANLWLPCASGMTMVATDGTHTLGVVATDLFGNVGDVKEAQFTVTTTRS
jgi:hypothetical protein